MENDKKKVKKSNPIFEVSWGVCNKIGSIHKVISTKAPLMQETYDDHFIMIGPDS